LKTRLMIVSASSRVVGPITEDVPAIDRYDGIMARIVKKYIREGRLDPRGILIVSPALGLVRALDPIPHHEPVQGDWRRPKLDGLTLQNMNRAALLLVKKITECHEFSEVYVNVGKKLYPIIAGIDKLVTCEIVYAKGRGLGPKAAHMRDWIISKKLG
jgi:hypothetical protein